MKTIYILVFTVVFAVACNKESNVLNVNPPPPEEPLETEAFTFLSNGVETIGKIYLPDSYKTNKNLPAIYLIDFKEGGDFTVTKDEFEKVVDGVQQIEGFDALVVSLENIPDFHADDPEKFQEYYDGDANEAYEIYKNMTSYVDSNYTNNASRTFIGKGIEAGVVLITLFLENSETSVFDNFIATDPSPTYQDTIISMIENDAFPQNKLDKKLHFSFSTTNNHEKCTTLINLIKGAHYPWLQFESIEYTNSNFDNTYPKSYAAGIKYIFN